MMTTMKGQNDDDHDDEDYDSMLDVTLMMMVVNMRVTTVIKIMTIMMNIMMKMMATMMVNMMMNLMMMMMMVMIMAPMTYEKDDRRHSHGATSLVAVCMQLWRTYEQDIYGHASKHFYLLQPRGVHRARRERR